MKERTDGAKPRGLADGVAIYCAHDKVVEIGALTPNPKNPNKHPESQLELLAKIIRSQGWRQPIKVSTRSGMIVSGHGRYEAAKLAGLSYVPVDYQPYETEEEELADLLADNRIAELADMDEKMLADIFSQIDESDLPSELTGYTDEITSALLDAVGDDSIEAEVPFTEVLREEHNYVVLYFDNEVDWLQAESLFNLETVKSLSTRTDGKITASSERRGVGRVLKGADALEVLRSAYQCELPKL